MNLYSTIESKDSEARQHRRHKRNKHIAYSVHHSCLWQVRRYSTNRWLALRPCYLRWVCSVHCIPVSDPLSPRIWCSPWSRQFCEPVDLWMDNPSEINEYWLGVSLELMRDMIFIERYDVHRCIEHHLIHQMANTRRKSVVNLEANHNAHKD